MGVIGQRRPVGGGEERPRHPEVNQERTTRLEPNNQILAATIDQRDALAIELMCDLERVERTCQPWIGDPNGLEDPAFEDGRQPPANRLDLGQLGHVRTVAGCV
jgi:hypothetical protein